MRSIVLLLLAATLAVAGRVVTSSSTSLDASRHTPAILCPPAC